MPACRGDGGWGTAQAEAWRQPRLSVSPAGAPHPVGGPLSPLAHIPSTSGPVRGLAAFLALTHDLVPLPRVQGGVRALSPLSCSPPSRP